MSGLNELLKIIRNLIRRFPLLILTILLIYWSWPEWVSAQYNLLLSQANDVIQRQEFRSVSSALGLDNVVPVLMITLIVAITEVHYSILLVVGAAVPPQIYRSSGIPRVHWTVIRDAWRWSGEPDFARFELRTHREMQERLAHSTAAGSTMLQISKAYMIISTLAICLGLTNQWQYDLAVTITSFFI